MFFSDNYDQVRDCGATHYLVFDFRLGRANSAEARFARRLGNSGVLMMYMYSNGGFERSDKVSVVIVLPDRGSLEYLLTLLLPVGFCSSDGRERCYY